MDVRGEPLLGDDLAAKRNRRLALIALAAKTWSAPALAGDLLLVRNDREAACYRLPKTPRPHRRTLIAGRIALQSGRASPRSRAMDWLTDPDVWVSLLTLTVLEIILGIDNIVFISILAGKLPAEQQAKARQTGLSLALITRVLLLCGLAWMVKLTDPLFHIPAMGLLKEPHPVSGRDLILLGGGLFLLWKSTHEIHDKLEGEDGSVTSRLAPTFASVVIQILLLDIVFSLDSVITAVGMARRLEVMIAAVILALVFMLIFSGRISAFIQRHPTLKMLALSFLMLIGCALVAEGFHKEVPKGYIYFAMAFSVGVESLNIRLRAKQAGARVELHQPYR